MAKILVIEDSGYQRRIIRNFLEEEGHDVIDAPNPVEGFKLVDADKPDLITMDILMPEMDGTQALEEMKKRGTNVPVIIVSADIQESTQKICMNLGAVGFVNKPITDSSRETLKNLLSIYLE